MSTSTTHSEGLTVDVVDAAGLPADWTEAGWRHPVLALHPRRVARLDTDARWSVRFLVGRSAGSPVAVLPVCRPRTPTMLDPDYDVARVAAEAGVDVPADARDWALIGGCRDLGSGVLVGAGVPEDGVDPLRAAMIARAFGLARAEGLYPAAMHVPDSEVDGFTAGAGGRAARVSVGEAATLHLPFSTMDEYLASLPGPRRNKIRRDWRAFREAGLRVAEEPAADLFDAAAPLVAEVKRRHGIADHARLALLRLRQWRAAGIGEYLAYVVRDADDVLVGVCFVCRSGDRMEAHEVGLRDDAAVRHEAYLEAILYAPIRAALGTGVRHFELGTEATVPKRLRGARVSPMWAVLDRP
ncbi:hypothetical protein [Longispora urticae]